MQHFVNMCVLQDKVINADSGNWFGQLGPIFSDVKIQDLKDIQQDQTGLDRSANWLGIQGVKG